VLLGACTRLLQVLVTAASPCWFNLAHHSVSTRPAVSSVDVDCCQHLLVRVLHITVPHGAFIPQASWNQDAVAPNWLRGGLVGGPDKADGYQDVYENVAQNQAAIHYTAGTQHLKGRQPVEDRAVSSHMRCPCKRCTHGDQLHTMRTCLTLLAPAGKCDCLCLHLLERVCFSACTCWVVCISLLAPARMRMAAETSRWNSCWLGLALCLGFRV
jgi:Glycosyl hydrolase family 9